MRVWAREQLTGAAVGVRKPGLEDGRPQRIVPREGREAGAAGCDAAEGGRVEEREHAKLELGAEVEQLERAPLARRVEHARADFIEDRCAPRRGSDEVGRVRCVGWVCRVRKGGAVSTGEAYAARGAS